MKTVSHKNCCFIPQVHGVANDTIAFVKNILNTELNSATDNPVTSFVSTSSCLKAGFKLT